MERLSLDLRKAERDLERFMREDDDMDKRSELGLSRLQAGETNYSLTGLYTGENNKTELSILNGVLMS
jgi:hypothetical protein